MTLLSGIGLVVTALTMIAATTMATPVALETDAVTDDSRGVLREYYDPQLALRFYYPGAWQPQNYVEGVIIQPDGGSAEFGERGVIFAVLRAQPDETPPLPPMLQRVIDSDAAVRASDNVAVGGISGRETVIELEVDRGAAIPANSQLASALQATESQRLTVIVWTTQREGSDLWVIMADAPDGHHLATLQEIRNSIRWE